MSEQWSCERARRWYKNQPWIVGCNFIPSCAINQLEMWQEKSFNPNVIEKELSLARSINFNTVRVFLHDLVWEDAPQYFKARIDEFLQVSSENGIKPILVFFDDCWNPSPRLGRQPEPKPGVHNSGWVQSPGVVNVNDPASWQRLRAYMLDILDTFKNDPRILMWDLYNEPGNSGQGDRSLPFVEAVFSWSREVLLSQPITMGVWFDNEALNRVQLTHSDIISFHDYHPCDHLVASIERWKQYGRPVICTEYMARSKGSRFETHLPIFAREGVGCINWGLVNGKTQTHLPWSSETPSELWFHDIFTSDYQPYDSEEVKFIRDFIKLTRGE